MGNRVQSHFAGGSGSFVHVSKWLAMGTFTVTFCWGDSPKSVFVIIAAELGEEPMCIRRTRSVARYWNRVVQLPESRLVRLALMASVQLSILQDVPQRHRQRCWAEQAANLLSLNLTVQSQLPDIATASLIECQQERYTSELTRSPLTKIKEYIALLGSDCFMQPAQPALYLQNIQSRGQRRALAQLRTGSHWLAVELGR